MYSVKQLVTLLSEPGDGIIVQTPAYDAFYKMIKENKRKIVPNALIYDAKSYRIDFEELTRLMAQPENKVLLLCSPHNPTGRVWQRMSCNESSNWRKPMMYLSSLMRSIWTL